jgi:hypothetical protein
MPDTIPSLGVRKGVPLAASAAHAFEVPDSTAGGPGAITSRGLTWLSVVIEPSWRVLVRERH